VRSVLVVDDVADVRDLCRVVLESVGYAVAEATSAEEALASLTSAAPDYLLLDLMMPGMSGWDLLRRIRDHHVIDTTRVIVCSAYDGACEERRAFGEGAYAFLAKPFTPQDLIALVD